MPRGDVYRLHFKGTGREQQGQRLAVIVQENELRLTTVLVAPTSTRARRTRFRPTIVVDGQETQVMVEQTTAVDVERLGRHLSRLDREAMDEIDTALRLVLGLW